jgi:hypothetical protein
VTFLLSEDEALRNKLVGMVVTDQKASTNVDGNRKVGVWFGQPDMEVRNQSYPYITIDMIDISEDPARAHRGKVKPEYMDHVGTQDDWYIDWPVPINIDYQITTYSRQPRHDREILAQLLYQRLPLRFGVLEPDDKTVRRLDVINISKRDVTESGKRLFVNVIRVRVSSEIASGLLSEVYKVLNVNVVGVSGSRVNGNYEFTPIESYTQTA